VKYLSNWLLLIVVFGLLLLVVFVLINKDYFGGNLVVLNSKYGPVGVEKTGILTSFLDSIPEKQNKLAVWFVNRTPPDRKYLKIWNMPKSFEGQVVLGCEKPKKLIAGYELIVVDVDKKKLSTLGIDSAFVNQQLHQVFMVCLVDSLGRKYLEDQTIIKSMESMVSEYSFARIR
jgi:hypothetical protein